MAEERIDRWARVLEAATTRRRFGGLVAAALPALGIATGADARPKKMKKKKRGGCIPSCRRRDCGADGCGGICGACGSGKQCARGVCKAPPNCQPRGEPCTDPGGESCCGQGCSSGVCAASGASWPCHTTADCATVEDGYPYPLACVGFVCVRAD